MIDYSKNNNKRKNNLTPFYALAIIAAIAAIVFLLCSCTSNDDTEMESASEAETDEAERYSADESNIKINPNIAAYLQREFIWEMGSKKPIPADFFKPESLGTAESLDEETVSRFFFATPLTDEMLQKKGKYLVKIDCCGIVLDARLAVTDTTPPVINVPLRTEYEIGDTILYKKDVEVIDNSGEELNLMVDSSEVKSNMAGTYKVYYSVVDGSGNIGKAETEIVIKKAHIPDKEEVDALADELLGNILKITDGMTPLEQAKAIFDWCHDNIRYMADAEKGSLVQGAYDGLHYNAGDCYTYFATAAYLMDRCGIENLSVSRKSDVATHYWSLVNLGDGWYHFDCSPHRNGYKCFMQTDSQVKEYATRNEQNADYFTFDEPGMPDRAEAAIY